MHQLFVVEHRVQVRQQITAAAARLTWVCVRLQSTCVRTHIIARAGCAACDRGAALRATVVPLHVWVRSNAPSAAERTMAGSSL
jgi:hypothetical protein